MVSGFVNEYVVRDRPVHAVAYPTDHTAACSFLDAHPLPVFPKMTMCTTWPGGVNTAIEWPTVDGPDTR